MQRSLTVLAILAMCSSGFGANMLLNGDMTSPVGNGPCSGTPPGPTWEQGPPDSWTAVGVAFGRNSSVFYPPCASVPDGYWASSSITANAVDGYVYQTTVGTTTPGEYYVLKGKWGGNVNVQYYNLTMSIEVGEGTDPANLTNVKKLTAPTITSSTGINDLVAFSVPPLQATGSGQLTVVWRLKAQRVGPAGDAIIAFRLDDVSLDVATCLNPISVDSIANTALDMDASAPRGSTATVTITGSNFTNPPGLDVSLEQGATIIGPVTATVINSTQLTAVLPIPADAPPGRYDLRVALKGDQPPNQINCDPVVVSNAFLIYLPAMTNLSFEDPVAPDSGCPPATPLQGVPTDWAAFATTYWKWGNRMNRDGFVDDDDGPLTFAPGCPIPNGSHYATIASMSPSFPSQSAYVWQTIAVTPGTTYSVTAYAAGSGNNTVTLELLDGDENGLVIGSPTTIHEGSASYDWTFVSASGAPSGYKMTILFRIVEHQANVEHALHIDNVNIGVCNIPGFGATSVSPNIVDNDGVKLLTIGGSGFSGGSTPVVSLTRTGHAPINATNVTVINDSQLTCNVDVTGAMFGRWDVLVVHDGCIARTSDAGAYLMVVGTFTNGEFELPDVGEVQCGPPPVPVLGIPEGWSGDTPGGSFNRDANVWYPTCPCPLSLGGHYGSLATDGGGLLYAYQTVRVTPGQTYRFSGVFAGAGANNVYIALLDGADYTDFFNLLGLTPVREHTGSPDPEVYGWTAASVEGTAISNVMTVVWYMDAFDTEYINASHADGLSFGIPCTGTPPTITPPLVPNSGNQGQTVTGVTINGSNFIVGGTTVQLTKTGQPAINATNVQVAPGGTSLTCDLDLTGAAIGAWNVVVTTDPGCTATLAGGFTVELPPPCNTPPQDVDGDGDVDLTDFGVFQSYFNGPNRPYNSPQLVEKCKCLDVDPDDGDIDLTDFGKFQSCFNGPNRPAQGSC